MRTLLRVANRLAVALYRRGVARSAKRLPVLLLTVDGRRTGNPHTVPVAYFTHEGGYLVAASAGGAKREPQWFRNVRVARQARVQVGDRARDVAVRVPDPAERDRLWRDVVLREAPFFTGYERKAGRVIPVCVLTPCGVS
ncbi:nitroreductase/quinone reductase family protein [Amycolatopsis australiensis]|uniref:Deazaflavin-dependent oxidoreductase, nitroreductase family n=1 Tax=Amycolatopsis australiensis TaxID=546364 RepID=A0A1K1SL47_9PSEU|nr:nitroreductase/quinone reductase family protein [Amycolatopsis australiensis]SFW85043.1 deazaflavin-dependent oxidoreductase, nitroreductase family [Amycolatopsis australiensis]